MQEDLKELKSDVKELLQRSAVHNQLLLTHEARSLALQAGQEKIEAELAPIKSHVSFVDKILRGLGGIAITVATSIIAKWLFTFFT